MAFYFGILPVIKANFFEKLSQDSGKSQGFCCVGFVTFSPSSNYR